MKKLFFSFIAGALALFAFAGSAQAEIIYSLSEQQSGNESETWVSGQKDVLVSGGILNVFDNTGSSVIGKICQAQLSMGVILYDGNLNEVQLQSPPFQALRVHVDVDSNRTSHPITFTRIPGNQNNFTGTIQFERGLIIGINEFGKIQVRGDLSPITSIGSWQIFTRYTNLIPCEPQSTVSLPNVPFDFMKSVVPQKIDLSLDFVRSTNIPRVRRVNDSIASIAIKSHGVLSAFICPRISGEGLQPYQMRLVNQRGVQFTPNTLGCFDVRINPNQDQTNWTLTTDTGSLTNTIGQDTVTIDFVGFPGVLYKLTSSINSFKVNNPDLPKPIVLTYE